ncbi:MAG: DUF5011 domain-containing protein [Acholeplasmataceae bacterium]|nr:DUF5011 domain-containing protein [Acholeplasmataceae bacterium]
MKKISLFLLMFTMLFAIVACKDGEEPVGDTDTVKPVITGVATVEISVGEAFDPMAGVSATDDVDGDLTSAIVVSGDTVNVNRAGDYVVVYTVSDAAGNEAVKQRVVSVMGLAGFVNGDFSDDLNGWATWVNESQDVAATYSVNNGVAEIDITAQSILMDNNWWDVQLSQKTLVLKAFESYTLNFTVKADAARKMMVNIQGGGLDKKPINNHVVDVTTSDVVVSIDFFTTMDSTGGVELQFGLGTFHKVDGVPAAEQTVLGTVYISNVSIVAGPELENQAPTLTATTNILLPVGATNFLIKGGLTVGDDRDVLTLDDVTYTDTSEVPFVVGSPAVKGTYTFVYSVTDSDNETTTFTRTLYVADAFEIPGFADVDAVTGVPVGWETWYESTRGGLTVTTVDEVVEVDITNVDSVDGNIWENQFKVQNLAAFAGEYRLTFQAKADVARSIIVAMEGNGGVGLENISFAQALTTEWDTYTFDFSVAVDATVMNRNLQFWFGSMRNQDGFTGADDILTKLYFKNVSIAKTADIDYGDELAFEFAQGFYSDGATSVSPDTDALYNNYAVVTPIPKGLLPVGSSIMIENGYQFRVIFLERDGDGFKVVHRNNNSSAAYTYVSESFWGDYQYISFNISSVPTGDISARLAEVAGMLTLYHPTGTLDNHIDYDLEWTNGYVMTDDTSVTASPNHLISSPLTPAFYNLDTVIEVPAGYKFAYVVYTFADQVYTASYVSDYQTEQLWVNPTFAEDKAIIGFIVTTTDETTALLPEDIDMYVDMHPNQVIHYDQEITLVTGYWADNATSITTGDTDFHKKYAASNVLSKAYFDGVSEIVVADGYALKVIYLSYDGYGNYQVTFRTAALTGTITLDDAFWGTDMYIAFNFSTAPTSDISGELDTLVNQLTFVRDDLTFTSGYWGGGATSITTGDTSFIKQYAASDVVPRQFIPAGTIITPETGYKVKLIFLSYSAEEGYKVLFRTGDYSEAVLITEAMYKDYQYIAFNISSTTGGTDISGELATLPNQLVFSMFDEVLVDHVDTALSFQQGYYNDNATSITTGTTAFDLGFAASNVLSKASFDGKGSIVVDAGYQIKVIYIGYDHNTYTVMMRTGYLTGTIVLDDAFWGDYEYIAFNIASVPSSDLTGTYATLATMVSFVDAE